MMPLPKEPTIDIPTNLGPPIRPPAPPAPAPTPTGTPGVLRAPDGKLHTDIPFAGFDPRFCPGSNPENPQTEEDEDLPDGLSRDAGGTLRFTCRSCGHRESEWCGTPEEFEADDHYHLCGGSHFCLP